MAEQVTADISRLLDVKNHPGSFLISATLFILYTIATLIDVNGIIKSYNILDVENTTRTTIIFAYISGYYMYFLKLLISMLTAMVILVIIVVSIIALLSLFSMNTVQTGGMRGGDNTIGAKIEKGVFMVFRFFLVFYTVPAFSYFMFLFLVLIPLVFLFFLYVISKFYDAEKIKDKNLEKAPDILNTNHHFIMFVMSLLIGMGIVYVLIRFYYMQMDGSTSKNANTNSAPPAQV